MLYKPTDSSSPIVVVWVLVAQSGPTPCNTMDCSPHSSSVHGILQARILEWVAILFSRGSWPSDWTQVSHIAGRFFTIWATREVLLLLLEKINLGSHSLQSTQINFRVQIALKIIIPWQLFKSFGDQRMRNQCFYQIMLYTHTCTHTNVLSAGRGALKQSHSYPADGNLKSYNPFGKKSTACSSCLTQSYYFLELR